MNLNFCDMINVLQKLFTLVLLVCIAGYASAQTASTKSCDPKDCKPSDCRVAAVQTSATAFTNCDPKDCVSSNSKTAMAVQTAIQGAGPICDPKNCKPADCSALAIVNPMAYAAMLTAAAEASKDEQPKAVFASEVKTTEGGEKSACAKKCSGTATAVAVSHK